MMLGKAANLNTSRAAEELGLTGQKLLSESICYLARQWSEQQSSIVDGVLGALSFPFNVIILDICILPQRLSGRIEIGHAALFRPKDAML